MEGDGGASCWRGMEEPPVGGTHREEDSAEDLDGLQVLRHVEALLGSRLEESLGIVVALLDDGDDGTGILGLGTVASTLQQALGLEQVLLADGHIGQVDQGLRVVGIDIDGRLHHLIIFVAVRLHGLGHVPHLTERELVGLGLVDLLGLLEGEVTELERDVVVGAAQSGIDVLQQVAVVLRILLFDLPLLGIGLQRTVVDDGEDSVAVGQHVGGHLLDGGTQSLPVLSRSLSLGEGTGGQVVEALHVFGQALRTVGGEHEVVVVGRLRRGVAVDLHAVDAAVGVLHHHVERICDLANLCAVVHIVGLHLPLVHHEGDVGRAVERALLLGSSGHDVGECDKLVGVDLLEGVEVSQFKFQRVAASAEVTLQFDVSGAVPGLSLHSVGIADGLRRIVVSAHLQIVVGIHGVDAVALEDDVLRASREDERLHALPLRLVLADDDGREGTVAVGRHAERVEDEVERERGMVVIGSHLDVFGLQAGVSPLVARQHDGGLCSR